MTKVLVDIGTHLRFVAFGIECVLGAGLRHREIERVLADARNDVEAAKHYVFRDDGVVAVTGDVDDHEPETIWISVRGDRRLEQGLAELVDNARPHARRLDEANSDEGVPDDDSPDA